MKEALVIDGTYQIYRCMHQPNLAELRTKSGVPTGGVFGFLRMLNSVLKQNPNYTKIVCCFDAGYDYRINLYPEYKGTRRFEPGSKEDEEYNKPNAFGWSPKEAKYYQFKVLQGILPKMNIRTLRVDGYEADDLVSKSCEILKDDYKLTVMSDDYDFLQLVDSFDNITIHRPLADQQVTRENFKEITELDPSWYIIHKAMIGDSSDNIPGCAHGFGDKTAKKLLDLGEQNGVDPYDRSTLEKLVGLAQNHKSKVMNRFNDESYETLKRNLDLMDLNLCPFEDEVISYLEEKITEPTEFNYTFLTEQFKRHEFQSLAEMLITPTFKRLR